MLQPIAFQEFHANGKVKKERKREEEREEEREEVREMREGGG